MRLKMRKNRKHVPENCRLSGQGNAADKELDHSFRQGQANSMTGWIQGKETGNDA